MNKIRLSGAQLKALAVLTMTIDHIAMIFLPEESLAYDVMRGIGRIAYPVFCYLLTEGIRKTTHPKQYLLRLFLFAVVSEPFFDLAHPKENGSNVILTMFLSACAIFLAEWIRKKIPEDKVLLIIGKTLLMGVICFGFSILSVILHTDYEFVGVFATFIMYYLMEKKTKLRCFISVLLFCCDPSQFPAIFSLPPILLYSGERGRQNKWFFYIYYPGHLLLLYLFHKWIFTVFFI